MFERYFFKEIHWTRQSCHFHQELLNLKQRLSKGPPP